jgi:hypothetical protein
MKQFLGKRVLITVGNNDAVRQTCLQMLSPNGLYGYFSSDFAWDEHLGWLNLDHVEFHDVIGDQQETRADAMRRCYGG